MGQAGQAGQTTALEETGRMAEPQMAPAAAAADTVVVVAAEAIPAQRAAIRGQMGLAFRPLAPAELAQARGLPIRLCPRRRGPGVQQPQKGLEELAVMPV